MFYKHQCYQYVLLFSILEIEIGFVPHVCFIYYGIGPRRVLACAKERRPLPKQGFTCCLAMDGVKVLASGFDADEKVLWLFVHVCMLLYFYFSNRRLLWYINFMFSLTYEVDKYPCQFLVKYLLALSWLHTLFLMMKRKGHRKRMNSYFS